MTDPQREKSGHQLSGKEMQNLAGRIIGQSDNPMDYIGFVNKEGLSKQQTDLLLMMIRTELEKRKETKLYNFLKRTNRSGVILQEIGMDDEDICQGDIPFERKPIDENNIEIILNGRKMGILITSREDDETFTTFKPEPGVKTFYKSTLEEEMARKES